MSILASARRLFLLHNFLVAMAAAHDIIIELADLQPLLCSDGMTDVVKTGAVDQVVAKVQALVVFDVKDATSLLGAISSLPDACKESLQRAIASRLEASFVGGRPPTRTPQQLLTTPLQYLTSGDWLEIDAPDAPAVHTQWPLLFDGILLSIQGLI